MSNIGKICGFVHISALTLKHGCSTKLQFSASKRNKICVMHIGVACLIPLCQKPTSLPVQVEFVSSQLTEFPCSYLIGSSFAHPSCLNFCVKIPRVLVKDARATGNASPIGFGMLDFSSLTFIMVVVNEFEIVPTHPQYKMGSLPPVTTEAIALTEKKMDMTLDDIIKMSKKTTVKAKSQRTSNKSQRVFSKYRARDNISKANIQRSINAKSSAMRQGKLAELRSRNGPNQLIAVKEAARRAAVAPIRARTVQWNKRRCCSIYNHEISLPYRQGTNLGVSSQLVPPSILCSPKWVSSENCISKSFVPHCNRFSHFLTDFVEAIDMTSGVAYGITVSMYTMPFL
eukprot:Gb_22576 [translate_table: standard]